MYDRIPEELKALIQWCVWRYEKTDNPDKPTKVPYDPRTGKHMSVTNPQTWCSFHEAVAACGDWNKYNGIGFVFTPRDPYCGIDLDATDNPEFAARQKQIFEAFNSYSELSPSGRGLHIIIKANVPHGRKRDCVEIYSASRFFTMTGNVYRNAPIWEYNDLANKLWEEMQPPRSNSGTFISSLYQDQSDQEVFDTAASASNGDKFVALWNGDWQQFYSSQSEADFALIDIIAYYTQYIPQIVRMFRASELGKRDKARRQDYVDRMITRAFDNQPPPLDYSALMDQLEEAKAAHARQSLGGPAPEPLPGSTSAGEAAGSRLDRPSSETTPLPQPAYSIRTLNLDMWREHRPPGLLNQLVEYFLVSSPRPVYEISLVAALGLMSGICGRQFNASAAGLNQYLMLIADTGKGKEAVNASISRVITEIAKTHPAAKRVLGPADIASGQALLKHINDVDPPCFVSVVGEFGIKLRQITDTNANSADRTLMKVLLDLYGKSGANMVMHPSIYAEKAKNTEAINSPCFTLVGESTGERFYEALDETNVADGLLPRFTIIEYNGPRVPFNKNHALVSAPQNLIESLSNLILHCDLLAQNGTVSTIGIYPDAEVMLDDLNDFCDNQINASGREVSRQIWNRVHLKVYKLAGLLAVSHNPTKPIISAEMVAWASSLIITDARRLLGKFERGEIGERHASDDAVVTEMRTFFMHDYLMRQFHELPKYLAQSAAMHREMVIAYSSIQNRFANKASFRQKAKLSRMKSTTQVIKETLDLMEKIGMVRTISANKMQERYKVTGIGYQLIPETLRL